MKRTFALAPDVGLLVEARGRAATHFAAEYGNGPDASAPPVMALRVGPGAAAAAGAGTARAAAGAGSAHTFAGGHRLARWRVRVQLDADGGSSSCALQVAGPLALALVQSMVVEPLLSIATAAGGRVLLPAALLDAADGPVLVLGASGTGKSTLALRALAAGRRVAADDQVLLAADRACAGLSRRLRVYGDLPRVVPEAHALLGASARSRVALAGAVARLTSGRVSPPVLLSPATLDPDASCPGRDVRPVRALLLGSGRPRARVGADELLATALELLAEQRSRLAGAGVRAPAATLAREKAILESALGELDAERADIRGAADQLAALDRLVGP